MKKYNEIQLTKNKIDLRNRKMTNHPPAPMNCNNTKYFPCLTCNHRSLRIDYVHKFDITL